MTFFEEIQLRWPEATPEAAEALLWLTPFPFVSGAQVCEVLDEMRRKWGAKIADAINGEMDEFDKEFARAVASRALENFQ